MARTVVRVITGFRLRREEVLGLILFGRFDQLVLRYLAFLRIDRAAKKGDRFGSERAFNKWRRAEHKILYGRPLTRHQAERVKALIDENTLLRIDIVKLMSAGAITESGELKINPKLHIALASITILGTTMVLVWLSAMSNQAFTDNAVSLVTAAVFFTLNASIVVIPATFLTYCSLAPLRAFVKAKKTKGFGDGDHCRETP